VVARWPTRPMWSKILACKLALRDRALRAINASHKWEAAPQANGPSCAGDRSRVPGQVTFLMQIPSQLDRGREFLLFGPTSILSRRPIVRRLVLSTWITQGSSNQNQLEGEEDAFRDYSRERGLDH
jgi:hypothetical protein